MSRAELFVPTCSRIVVVVLRAAARRSPAGDVDDLLVLGLVVGRDVVAGVVLVVVVDAVDRRLAEPVPRGSQPTMSKRSSSASPKMSSATAGEVAAAEPGPAGVDEQRADLVLLVVGEVAGDEQLERRRRRGRRSRRAPRAAPSRRPRRAPRQSSVAGRPARSVVGGPGRCASARRCSRWWCSGGAARPVPPSAGGLGPFGRRTAARAAVAATPTAATAAAGGPPASA